MPVSRILHLVTTFHESSGAAENTRLTLNGLDRARFQPVLGVPAVGSVTTQVKPDVEIVPLRHLRRSLHPYHDAAALAEIVGVIRRHRIDLVHTHNAKDGVLGRWAARLAHRPAVHTIHNVSFRASTSALVNSGYALAERLTAPITARLLAVSTENSRVYLARGIGRPEQFLTVYSGLALERYGADPRSPRDIRASMGLPDEPGPWIGWFGRFNHQKDPLTFVRAARLVRDAFPGARFVVCGDDPLGDALEGPVKALATELDLLHAMHFLGFRRDLPSVIQAVQLVMHSSSYEGMGRVICEALASRRPVVGTAVDGVVEVVVSGERGGLLVPPGQPAALAQASISLLQDPVRAALLAGRGRDWIAEHVSADAMVAAIERVYDEAQARYLSA